MSRRSGQDGYFSRKGNQWHVRFYIDVPGQEKRKRLSIPVCPISGPGKMTLPERIRRAKEIINASGANSEEHFNRVEAANLGLTFGQQADRWLKESQSRKRKPVKPKTVCWLAVNYQGVARRLGSDAACVGGQSGDEGTRVKASQSRAVSQQHPQRYKRG